MEFPRLEINQKYVDCLEQEMMIKIAQATGAQKAWLVAKLQLCENGYRFKRGQRITVHYSNGAIDYIFEKLDWDWSNRVEPVIHAQEILKSGKLSKFPVRALCSDGGGIPWDAQWVVPASDKLPPTAK